MWIFGSICICTRFVFVGVSAFSCRVVVYSRYVIYVSASLFWHFMRFQQQCQHSALHITQCLVENLLYVGLLRVDYIEQAALHSSGFEVKTYYSIHMGFSSFCFMMMFFDLLSDPF